MAHYYQLSPHYRLSPKSAETPMIQNTLSEETFLINNVIHSFLSFFEEKPITFLESIKLFIKKFGGENDEVTMKVNQFFGDMFYQSIIIRAENYTQLVNFPTQKKMQELLPLFDFETIKTLSEEYFLSIYLVKNRETEVKSVLKILHLNAFFTEEEKKNYRKAFLQEVNI